METSGDAEAFLDWLASAPAVGADELKAKIAAHRVHQVILDRRLGGGHGSTRDFAQLIRRTARLEPSTAWQLVSYNTLGSIASRVPGAEDLLRDPATIVVAGTGYGRVAGDDDDVAISGTWTFGSGIRSASWVIAWSSRKEKVRPSDRADILVCLVPVSACRLDNDWDTIGMRATESVSFTVEAARPAHACTLEAAMRSPLHLGSLSFLSLFALGFSALGVGALERAIGQFRDITTTKTPIGSDAKLGENPEAQAAIGFAHAASLAAWTCIERCAEILTKVASGEVTLFGSPESVELKALSTFALRTVFDAAQRIYLAAGTTVIHHRHPLTRTLLDIQTLSQHVHGRVSNFREIGIYNLTGEIRFIL